MSKVLLIPIIFLLASCILVGANNFLNGDNNRPLTLLELIEETNISVSGFAFTQTIVDSWFQDKEDFDNDNSAFGSDSYAPDTEFDWLNSFLSALNAICSPFIYVFRFVGLPVGFIVGVFGDITRILFSTLSLVVRFIFGVPV